MKPLREDILEQGRRLKAAADLRVKNEQKIRESLSKLSAKPRLADLLETMRKIREVLGL